MRDQPAPPGRKPTQAERIRASLAEAIVRGELGPGVPLDEVSIAEKFQVSRTPVREAIRQLEAIGFAEARPHRGAVVPHFTPEKLNDMFIVMAEMEALCTRYAASHVTAAERGELLRRHEACAEAARQGDVEEYYVRNIAFHDAIYRASHNAYLVEVTLSVRNRLAPFRKLQFEGIGRLSHSLAEHDAILQAIFRGDGEGAATLMRRHMQLVRTSVGEVSPSLRGEPAEGAAGAGADLPPPSRSVRVV
ncbi:MAG: GntR family transcriptional regulator [Bauldia sp.]|nr:GntR family transcriptional regulator [Bauldia sp.]